MGPEGLVEGLVHNTIKCIDPAPPPLPPPHTHTHTPHHHQLEAIPKILCTWSPKLFSGWGGGGGGGGGGLDF